MNRLIDLTGLRFGKLTVISRVPVDDSRRFAWRCICDCGGETFVAQTKLSNGSAKACKCGNPVKKTHGMSGTRAYNTWCGMLTRCRNENVPEYDRYGGSGVEVCDRWLAFENFYRDMGDPPDGMSIDRVDGSKGYSPDNCRWATIVEQNRNRSNVRFITVGDFTGTVSDWSERTGISFGTIHRRISKGMPPEDAVRRPIDKSKSRSKKP